MCHLSRSITREFRFPPDCADWPFATQPSPALGLAPRQIRGAKGPTVQVDWVVGRKGGSRSRGCVPSRAQRVVSSDHAGAVLRIIQMTTPPLVLRDTATAIPN